MCNVYACVCVACKCTRSPNTWILSMAMEIHYVLELHIEHRHSATAAAPGGTFDSSIDYIALFVAHEKKNLDCRNAHQPICLWCIKVVLTYKMCMLYVVCVLLCRHVGYGNPKIMMMHLRALIYSIAFAHIWNRDYYNRFSLRMETIYDNLSCHHRHYRIHTPYSLHRQMHHLTRLFELFRICNQMNRSSCCTRHWNRLQLNGKNWFWKLCLNAVRVTFHAPYIYLLQLMLVLVSHLRWKIIIIIISIR